MPPTPGYLHVAEVTGGRTIHVSGQVAFTDDLAGAIEGDLEAQARQVLENLKAALGAAGLGFGDVVKLGPHLTGISRVSIVREGWVEVAPGGSETAIVLAHGFGTWGPEKVGGRSRKIVAVDDTAGTAEALKAEGVEFEAEPEESPYGLYAQVRDPDGSVFGLLPGTARVSALERG